MKSLTLLELFDYLSQAFGETILMCGIALILSVILGVAIGLFIFTTRGGFFWNNKVLNFAGGLFINIIRSIPFIILLVLLLPVTKVLIGTTIGPVAASVSLSIASLAYFSRIVESSLNEVDKGVIEAAKAFGVSNWLIIWGGIIT